MYEYEGQESSSDKELENSMFYIKITWLICNGIIVILALILFLCIYCYRKIDKEDSGAEKKSSKKSDSTKTDESNKLNENLIKYENTIEEKKDLNLISNNDNEN